MRLEDIPEDIWELGVNIINFIGYVIVPIIVIITLIIVALFHSGPVS